MSFSASSSTSDLAYFRQLPWCQIYLNDPNYVPVRGISRGPFPNKNQHSLLSTTLNTPSTFPHVSTLYKKPPDPTAPVTEAITILEIGSGMNGHIDTAHGGTVATILDEVAGIMLRLGREPAGNLDSPIFTAYLNINYRKPVRTPQVVIVRARIVDVTGRKKKIWVELVSEKDGVLADADALFVRSRDKERRDGGKL